MHRSLRRRLQFATLVGGLALLSACSQERPGGIVTFQPGEVDYPPVTDYIEDVGGDGVPCTYVGNPLPESTVGGAPLVLGAREYVEGGSFAVLVTPDPASTELLVSVRNTDPGYWSIDLTAAPKRLDGSVLIFVTPRPDSPRRDIRLKVVESDGTNVSLPRYFVSTMNLTAASSQYLQVSLNWVHGIDLDLHLEDPNSETIYFGHLQGSNGGTLDLDSNAGCNLDYINNENITWPSSVPPVGAYTIRVDLWDQCDETGPFPYLVTWSINGQSGYYIGEMADGASSAVDVAVINYSTP